MARATGLRFKSPKWRRVRVAVHERDDYTCQGCGVRATPPPNYDGSRAVELSRYMWLVVDHNLSTARGGGDELDNLQTLCKTCNGSKGAQTMDEWLGREGH